MKAKQMDIKLKQTEIEAAVHRYVAETIGVNLTGKRLGITFSATRGTEGIIANLVIEDTSDIQIPGYTDRNADPVAEAPKATVHNIGSAIAAEAASSETEVAPEVVKGAEAPADAEVAKSGLFAD